MRHLFDPRLVNDEFGDPGLFVDLRDERRALLFDLGDLSALPPRLLMRLSHVFVSHTHMDHFVGFDGLVRVLLGRKRGLVLFGGPGFVDQVEHKLRAYTWNVVHRYAVALVLDVREIAPDGRRRQARFSSRTGFVREPGTDADATDDVLHDEALLRVRGRFVDHEMPCLAFALEAKPRPRVAKDRLQALGLGTGPWLHALKQAIRSGAPAHTPIRLSWRDRSGVHEATRSVGELSAAILDVVPGQRIGYATDLRFSDANRRSLAALMNGVDWLFIESVFLDIDRAHAQRKNHLTAWQAGRIARELGARAVVPFHFSPRYRSRPEDVAAELRAGRAGGPDGPGAAQAACRAATDEARSWTRALR
jgi:ribonuclease Z